MAELLTPDFELFRSEAQFISQLCERVPEAVRIGIGQTRTGEGVFENLLNLSGAAPMLAR